VVEDCDGLTSLPKLSTRLTRVFATICAVSGLYILSMPIRMKDLAEDLGVSVVTISKVLRDHPDIGKETRERVLKRVKELRYQPNATARSLVTGRSYLIGLVVPDLIHPFFAEVAKALSMAIQKKGYSLIIASSEENPLVEEREIEQMMARRLDGLIVASSGSSQEPFRRLQEAKQPYVLIDRKFAQFSANFVGTDDVAVGRLATEHLIDVGCKRIAHIRGRNNSTGLQRFEGYRQALSKGAHSFSKQYVIQRETVDIQSRQQGAIAMQSLLALNPKPDGVFCYNDPLAIGAMDTILAAGLSIPGDIAIIGCGNLHYDDALRVPLSSVDQQNAQVGEAAGKLLLAMLSSKNGRSRPKSIVLEPHLVPRASTARLAPGSRFPNNKN
jgi:LacI family transcriptional regulator